MLVREESWLRRKIKHWLWKSFCRLEYVDVAGLGFYRNGEAKFIDSVLQIYSKDVSNQPLEILDIGSHIGEYADLLKAMVERYGILARIHLFEPTNESFAHLEKKLGNQENLILNNFAISEMEGPGMIFYDRDVSPLASLYQRSLSQYNISMDKSQPIYLKRADNYIHEKAIKHIHLCKIDVEGHELSVLRSFGEYLNGEFIDFIQFEYGETYFDAHIRLLEVYQLLESRDFKIAKITPDGLILKPYRRYMENFIYANYAAISKRILKLVL